MEKVLRIKNPIKWIKDSNKTSKVTGVEVIISDDKGDIWGTIPAETFNDNKELSKNVNDTIIIEDKDVNEVEVKIKDIVQVGDTKVKFESTIVDTIKDNLAKLV